VRRRPTATDKEIRVRGNDQAAIRGKQTRREALCLLAAGAMGGFCHAAARSAAPNIIFILTDDLGWTELGCFGNRFNHTPSLDRLAQDGVRFSSAYAAAPVCSPTRASIMTGLYPVRVGITDYLRGDDSRYLSPDRGTLPKLLREAGYRTGLIGKWHLTGDYALRRGDPTLHGFDEVICSETRYIGAGSYFYPYAFMPQVQARQEGEYLTDRLNQEAVDFIARNAQRRFFLFLSHYAPHTRLAGKPDKVARYAGQPGAGKNRNNPELAAMLESIDEGVGMIRSKLQELGIARQTMLAFMSDNGGETNVTSNAPLRGGKSQLYEGGIRVPFIVSWPGHDRPGSECRAAVNSADLYPTFLQVAGAAIPAGLDGQSMVGLIGHPSSERERTMFWYYPLDKQHFLGGRSSAAVRRGDFKLIQFLDTGQAELYDLREDPGESKDLSPSNTAKTGELQKVLRDWTSQFQAGGGR
jgi:arylsulfatase A-like enzyme